jgi:hypothetical protein
VSNLALSEVMRIVERMVIIGTVVEFDPATAKARVSLGPGVVSGWLAIAQMGSKDVRIWLAGCRLFAWWGYGARYRLSWTL